MGTTRLLLPWDSPGKNTEVGFHALLQGIFLSQGLNPHLLWLLIAGRLFAAEPPGKPMDIMCNMRNMMNTAVCHI